MQLEYEFTVPVPVSQAWTVLLDLERVVPCLPGATLTSYDGDAFAGTVRVKLGPVNLTYQGKGRFVSRDEDAGRVVIEASGRESRGGGTATTTATMTMTPTTDGASTVVAVQAELSVTGRPAQFGRGMIADVGGKLVGQFADCLAQRLAESRPPAGDVPTAQEAELVAAADGLRAVPAGDGAPAGGPTVAVPEPAVEQAPAAAPPVDLLRVSAGPAVRRVAPYAIGFLVGALVVWALGHGGRPG
ncbi:Carbon monoxide dehydrogenase subunit G [Micromonospora rhizosphaerae]|uniref:Carbon monoxide dehydrogenase subunit G n=1 Tax=Micromonospora rhizosphaerae TaxID=568872 RepID=A0A1C6SJM8_9ACTN|nr:SRPBCC family protein [Micromonospora rhizosphaerae]SCL29691.1 Carbon monoxide dehydrogenase subunit G [Micromonospora rhizosphaerae]